MHGMALPYPACEVHCVWQTGTLESEATDTSLAGHYKVVPTNGQCKGKECHTPTEV